jgi:predicted ATPase/DNA-binding winged helix-turn-helix (wHTH) protein
MNEPAIGFGPFRLITARRLLLEGDRPVRLGSRAFDILVALVERAGEVVSKDDLIARGWPGTFVEEANLKIQISALRRVLGDGQGDNRYVVTVVGRGYNFVAPTRTWGPSRPSPSESVAVLERHNLPFATTRMIGRDQIVTALVTHLSRRRLVTVVGPGGIGKTTVALAVAERMIGAYEHGVWLVDLAPLRDSALVPSAVATALGLGTGPDDPLRTLVAALSDRQILLTLDNCEHVIDAVARLAEALLTGTAGVNILATSREPLSVRGERVNRLGPLGSPEPSPWLRATEAASFPAVQLFVERVTAIVDDFVLTDANASLVVAICRRLDGLPLAIEFAAPCVEALGVEALAARLDDTIRRLSGPRRRVALPRHQTIRAVADWSYGLLIPDEQRFFRALAIFAGGFTANAAATVAMDATKAGADAIDLLADLVAKSLVIVDVSGVKPRFRLLDTTRAYALERLDTSGEHAASARRHAEYYRILFERAEGEAATRFTDEWLPDCAREIDNLRAALDWSFSPDGAGSVGVALTAAAVPLWIHLSLLEECRRRAHQALGTASAMEPREAMRLHAALGSSTSEASEMVTAFTRALDIARRLGDDEYQLRALRGLHFHHLGIGQFRAAHPFAREFHALSRRGSDHTDLLFGERMMGTAEHYVGKQLSARRYFERVLARNAGGDQGGNVGRFQDVVRFGTDVRTSTQVFLARVLWLQGLADQAIHLMEKSLNEAEATSHAITRCFVLAMASCPIAFWVGDQVAAARYTDALVNLSREHSLPHWAAFGARFERVFAVKVGGLDRVSRPRFSGHVEKDDPNFSFRTLTALMPHAEALGQAGRITESLALLEAGIGQCEANCFTPELVRLKGELFRFQGVPDAGRSAEIYFRQALDGAREYGTLSWELRAATSLAHLLSNQGRPADARACLRPIYDRFTEGFGTADLIAAKQLLDDLRAPALQDQGSGADPCASARAP